MRLSQRFGVRTAKAGRSVNMPLKIRMFMLLWYWCPRLIQALFPRCLFRCSEGFLLSDGKPFRIVFESSDSITGSYERTIMDRGELFSVCMLRCCIILSLLQHPERQVLLTPCVVLDTVLSGSSLILVSSLDSLPSRFRWSCLNSI